MMKLWFAPNTCARVTLTALEEIGEPYDTALIAFMAGEHRKPEFLAVNPSGKVPALETSYGTLVQNGAILEYLAETHPDARLLPAAGDAFERAAIRAELYRCSADLHPIVTRFVIPQMMTANADGAPHIREQARAMMEFQLAPVAARLAASEWYFGTEWSVLDAYIAWIWFRLTGSGFDADSFPSIRDHYARAMARPSAQAALTREAEAEKELDARGLLFRPPFAKGDRK
ncbi:glutathione S-transferase family protein [Altererythrobacter salegens]|uniref:Glutathione S-transferase family protein n=1 Tax=Croceibacterium salegens TaxID=1737568 RepID=A0A6I4SYB0_9SPHN|nr:glutathione S-transferase family protein [Croceibacterium salegens]MXO60991.1 glutathione S-transferase family protein [Croceibacterium salegens]